MVAVTLGRRSSASRLVLPVSGSHCRQLTLRHPFRNKIVTIRRISVAALATAAVGGLCGHAFDPYYWHQRFAFHNTKRLYHRKEAFSTRNSNVNTNSSSPLIDLLLPAELDLLPQKQKERLLVAMGAQILLFSGWTQEPGLDWKPPSFPPAASMTLQDRLDRITPTWKAGGTLEYALESQRGLFGDLSTNFLPISTRQQLVRRLEETIGFQLEKYILDPTAQKALQAMLSWRMPSTITAKTQINLFSNNNSPPILLIFSFDATRQCFSVEGCPRPGPTNELLAATCLHFLQQHTSHSPPIIIAQWEVAAALRNFNATLPVISVGTPGEFQNTAAIFELMLQQLKSHDDADNPQTVILLAHPDHLRRVFWTAETILKKELSLDSHTTNQRPILALIPAMMPYDLAWPYRGQNSSTQQYAINLFETVPSTPVHSQGKITTTNWFMENHGYFPDGDPQQWTHAREVYLLYDQWAVLKGIVTGTIDLNMMN